MLEGMGVSHWRGGVCNVEGEGCGMLGGGGGMLGEELVDAWWFATSLHQMVGPIL